MNNVYSSLVRPTVLVLDQELAPTALKIMYGNRKQQIVTRVWARVSAVGVGQTLNLICMSKTAHLTSYFAGTGEPLLSDPHGDFYSRLISGLFSRSQL